MHMSSAIQSHGYRSYLRTTMKSGCCNRGLFIAPRTAVLYLVALARELYDRTLHLDGYSHWIECPPEAD